MNDRMSLSLTSEAEADLLERFGGVSSQERDAAFEDLFERFRRPLLSLCFHLTRDSAEAEDAVQETFLAVFRALPVFRGEARLSTWIYRIATRTALRVRARRPPTERLEPLEPVVGESRSDRAAGSPEEAMALRSALSRLPADQRLVLALFSIEGLSHGEIAEVLGIPQGTVWSRLHGARKRLAAEISAPTPSGKRQVRRFRNHDDGRLSR